VTEDNRRKNISVEAKRGDDSLESARILLAAAMHADAVSRAYYGAYARALLLTVGEEPETHGGVHKLPIVISFATDCSMRTTGGDVVALSLLGCTGSPRCSR
jgi:uncharacterized protein (UPF0332 family)